MSDRRRVAGGAARYFSWSWLKVALGVLVLQLGTTQGAVGQPASPEQAAVDELNQVRVAVGLRVSWRTLAVDGVLAVTLVIGISVLVGAAESVSHVSNISNLYVIGVAILASRRGLFAPILASALAFLAYDWFFIPSIHAFSVDEPSEYVALLTLLVTIVIIGQLLAVARKRAGAWPSPSCFRRRIGRARRLGAPALQCRLWRKSWRLER